MECGDAVVGDEEAPGDAGAGPPSFARRLLRICFGQDMPQRPNPSTKSTLSASDSAMVGSW